MSIRNKLVEASARSWKSRISLYLRQEGYVTYADRLNDIKFVIADVYKGHRVEVAAMFLESAEMVINPAMVDETYFQGQTKKMMDQLSVLVRHELLHFLLVHNRRMEDHLAKRDPNWKKVFKGYSIYELSNYAADWDLSNEGYDEHDKEIVRRMTRNGKVIGGLILSDDHPEWLNLSYEEILDKLIKERSNAINQAKKDLETTLQKLLQDEDNDDNLDDEEDGSVSTKMSGTSDSSDEQNNENGSDDESESENNSQSEDNSANGENTDNQKSNSQNSSSENDDSKESEDDENEDKKVYAISWNEIMDRFDNDEITEDELEQLIADIKSGKIVSL